MVFLFSHWIFWWSVPGCNCRVSNVRQCLLFLPSGRFWSMMKLQGINTVTPFLLLDGSLMQNLIFTRALWLLYRFDWRGPGWWCFHLQYGKVQSLQSGGLCHWSKDYTSLWVKCTTRNSVTAPWDEVYGADPTTCGFITMPAAKPIK